MAKQGLSFPNLPDHLMQNVLRQCTPCSLVSLRQVNRAWHEAATCRIVGIMLAVYAGETGPAEFEDPKTVERALRRQYRFERIFTHREVTLPKPDEFNNDHSFTQRKDILISIHAGSTLKRWDLTDDESTTLHSGANHYCWGADRSELVYAEEFGSVFHLYDVADPKEESYDLDFGFADITLALDYDPKHQVVAAGSWAGTCAARILTGPHVTIPLPAMGHETTGFEVKIVDAGRQVLHTGPDWTRSLTSLAQPEQSRTLPVVFDSALFRASPSSSCSDAMVAQGSLSLINFGSWPIEIKTLLPSTLQIFDTGLLARGDVWVTLGRDRNCRVWKLKDDTPVCLWKRRGTHSLTRLWVASQRDLFAYGDSSGTIHIRELVGDRCISRGRMKSFDKDKLRRVDFSEDGAHVLVDSEGPFVRIKRLVPRSIPQVLSCDEAFEYRYRARHDR